MAQVKTSDLSGAALNWAVAKGEDILDRWGRCAPVGFKPSTDWTQGGPIIEREGITVSKEEGTWSSYFRDCLFNDDGSDCWSLGDSPLIAAMRCYVASKLGDVVEIPEELC